MHLLIPFAADTAEAASHVLRDLALPQLGRLLARLSPTERDAGAPDTLNSPHERALARAWGWHGADGALPFAAQAAQADGIAVGGHAWGLLTPAHWLLGRDHASLVDPQALALEPDESHALLEAVRPLFESEGYTLAWGAPLRWYAAHDSLADLPCASLDRVIGRNVETWLAGGRHHAPSRTLRRLQSEVQMQLYAHPVNERREARGALTVNSFWLSGCGRAQPADPAAVQVDAALRAPLLAQDWAGWADAWRGLDAGPVAALLRQVEEAGGSRPAPAAGGASRAPMLTLCGERAAQRYEALPRPLLRRLVQRWSAPSVADLLEAL